MVRYQLEQDQTQWPTQAVETIMVCARDMWMLKTETPMVGDFDLVIILGGARQSNLDRARYAAQAHGGLTARIWGQLVIAGSSRKLNDDEQQNVTNYAAGAEDEFDLCAAAARIVARESGIITSQFMVPDERAGTPAVLEAVIKLVNAGRAYSSFPLRIAAVTTQIYQLATEIDLVRVVTQLGVNASIMMASGCPSDPAVIAKRTTATYLSEVLRTLRAAALAAQAGV